MALSLSRTFVMMSYVHLGIKMGLTRKYGPLRHENHGAARHDKRKSPVFTLTPREQAAHHPARLPVSGNNVRYHPHLRPPLGQPSLKTVANRTGQAVAFNLVQRLCEKGKGEQIGGNVDGNAPRTQIKQRIVVNCARGRTM